MRAIYSYGVALLIVLGLAIWLGTGVLVQGGKGPGEGEKPVIGAIAPSEPALTEEQQKLLAEVQAKKDEAAKAKADADAADAAAKAAADAANTADTTGAARKAELAAEAKAKADEAAKAKAELDAATAAATAAQTAADKAKAEADAFRSIADRTTDEGNGASALPRSVRIEILTAALMPIDFELRGRTKAKSVVSVVAQTSGTVQSIAVTKGQNVKAGDLLCQIDPGARSAALAQAQAALAQAQTAYDTNASLREKGLAAPNSAGPLEAALKGAQAALQNAELELGRTDVKAPVDGVISDPMAEVGSMLAAGMPCATVVQLNPMLFIASLPEAKIAYANLGLTADVTTVAGDKATGKVTYIASSADEATRSFPVEITVDNSNGKIRDGITADATVRVAMAPVQVLPQSALTLDDNGVLGVRTVEDGNKVAFHEITIIKDTRDGVWVSNLPAKINLITVGQDFVLPGQIVDAKTVDGELPS